MKHYSLAALAITSALSLASIAAHASVLESDVPRNLATATMVGVLQADRPITVVLTLPLRDAKGAADFVAHATKSGDPLFRHWLTPQEFAARFGADPARYAAVANWARSQGLRIGEASSSGTVIAVSGQSAQIQAAFGVRMLNYRTPQGRAFFSADRAPTIPAEISQHVTSVIGLSDYVRFVPLIKIQPLGAPTQAGGHGPGGAFNAADLRKAYAITPQYPRAPSETIAIFEQGGFFQSDVDTYFKANNLPNIPVIVRNVNGYGGGVNDPSVEAESVLDIDMAVALNPALKQVIVYEDGANPFGVALLSALTAMADDNKAKTISISYGTDEIFQGTAQIAAEGALFTQLAAQGQAVFVSSGDQGAYGRSGSGLNAEDPGSQPLVTSVGGTTLFTTSNATYQSEEAWNLLGSFRGATGGGVSGYWPIPSYQLLPDGTPIATANGGSATLRNFPDIAAVGNPATGVSVYSQINGGWLQIGGTSASAPIWASYYSLLNAGSKALGTGDIGFFNPALYRLGLIYGDSATYHDIRDGSNGNVSLYGIPGYNAGVGFDNVAGWGSPDGTQFQLGLILNPPTDGTTPLPPAPTGITGTTTKTTATLKWTKTPGVKGYAVLEYDIKGSAPPKYQIVTAPTATFAGLRPGRAYAFIIITSNPGGSSRSTIYLYTQA